MLFLPPHAQAPAITRPQIGSSTKRQASRVGAQHEGGISDAVLVRSRTTKPTCGRSAPEPAHQFVGGANTGALQGSQDERAFGCAPKSVFLPTVVLLAGCFIRRPTVGATDSKPAARAVEMSFVWLAIARLTGPGRMTG
jgi:hypothetical protein